MGNRLFLLWGRYLDALATSALLSCVWELLLEFVQSLGKERRQHFLTGLLHVCHFDRGGAQKWVSCAVEPVHTFQADHNALTVQGRTSTEKCPEMGVDCVLAQHPLYLASLIEVVQDFPGYVRSHGLPCPSICRRDRVGEQKSVATPEHLAQGAKKNAVLIMNLRCTNDIPKRLCVSNIPGARRQG